MNKQLTAIGIIGILIAISISGCLEDNKGGNGNIVPSLSGKVTITTNKSEYEQNENVNFTLFNGKNESIYLSFWCGEFCINFIEKKTASGWELFWANDPNVIYDCMGTNTEIKEGESIHLIWRAFCLWVYNESNNSYEYYLVEPGVYRLKFDYFTDATWINVTTVYSNEFTIVNNSNDVLITTDKGIYNSDTGINDDQIQGDIINITIVNHLEKDIFFDTGFINPFCSLYFEIYNNGSWELYNDILGDTKYPYDFTFQKWLDIATKLSPNESLTFQYNLSHSSGLNMFQGKYRIKLDYFSIPNEPLVNYSDVDYATYRSEANFATVYSNNFTVMNFPIDTEEEAITYAITDTDVKSFIDRESAYFDVEVIATAYYTESGDIWTVYFVPEYVKDIQYTIRFNSDGTIIDEGQYPGA